MIQKKTCRKVQILKFIDLPVYCLFAWMILSLDWLIKVNTKGEKLCTSGKKCNILRFKGPLLGPVTKSITKVITSWYSRDTVLEHDMSKFEKHLLNTLHKCEKCKISLFKGPRDLKNRGTVTKSWYSLDTVLGHHMAKFENRQLNSLQIIMHARCKINRIEGPAWPWK